MKQVCMILTVVALCLAIPSLMLAQDNPVLGTWTLNLEKSKFTGMPTPKSLTRTVSADGVIKKISSHKYSATLKKAGKTVGTSAVVVSADGKTTTLTGKGTNGTSSLQVYDKQ
jgi:hypothetical protein